MLKIETAISSSSQQYVITVEDEPGLENGSYFIPHTDEVKKYLFTHKRRKANTALLEDIVRAIAVANSIPPSDPSTGAFSESIAFLLNVNNDGVAYGRTETSPNAKVDKLIKTKATKFIAIASFYRLRETSSDALRGEVFTYSTPVISTPAVVEEPNTTSSINPDFPALLFTFTTDGGDREDGNVYSVRQLVILAPVDEHRAVKNLLQNYFENPNFTVIQGDEEFEDHFENNADIIDLLHGHGYEASFIEPQYVTLLESCR